MIGLWVLQSSTMGHQALHGDSVSADSLTQKKSRSVSGTVHSAESFRGLGGILSSPRDGTVPFPPPRVQEMGASHQSLWWRRRRAEDWLPIRQVCHGPAHVSQSAFALYIYITSMQPHPSAYSSMCVASRSRSMVQLTLRGGS